MWRHKFVMISELDHKLEQEFKITQTFLKKEMDVFHCKASHVLYHSA